VKIDWSAVQAFLCFLAGELPVEELLRHPAYAAVCKHCRLAYGARLSPGDVEAAAAGRKSPFFGLRRLRDNLPLIRDFVSRGGSLEDGWLRDARSSLAAYASPADLDGVTIYPIVGYDAGIGLDGCACLNVNYPAYLEQPREFGYMLIHESSHVIYGRTRPMPDIAAARDSQGWADLFSRMTQDEGFAVYAPLALRRARGHMGDRSSPVLADYVVIADPVEMEACLSGFRETAAALAGPGQHTRHEYMEMIFGPGRLTYRAGCEIVRRAARSGGAQAVASLFRLPAEQFLAVAGHLVGIRRFGNPATSGGLTI